MVVDRSDPRMQPETRGVMVALGTHAMAAALRIQSGIEQPRTDYAFDVKPRWVLAEVGAG